MKQCLVLAAGLSSRMVRWKMLLPWRDATVLDCTLRTALSFCERVVLVTGHRAQVLHNLYHRQPRITLCYNPYFRNGMFSSVRCGIRHLAAAPFFVIPGDMPDVQPATYAALWAQLPDDANLIPCHQQRHGHPVLLAASMRDAILEAPESGNLGLVMQRYPRRSVTVDDPAILFDLDTPQEYLARRPLA